MVCPVCFNAKQLDKGSLITGAEPGRQRPAVGVDRRRRRDNLQLLTSGRDGAGVGFSGLRRIGASSFSLVCGAPLAGLAPTGTRGGGAGCGHGRVACRARRRVRCATQPALGLASRAGARGSGHRRGGSQQDHTWSKVHIRPRTRQNAHPGQPGSARSGPVVCRFAKCWTMFEDDGAHVAVTRYGRHRGSDALCRSATSGAPRLAAGCPPPGPTTATPSRTTRAAVSANATSAPLGIQDDALSGPTNVLTLRALVLPDDGRALGC